MVRRRRRRLERARAAGLAALAALAGLMSAGRCAAAAPLHRDDVTAAVAEAEARFGVPASWVIAVMRAESAGDPRAVSAKGALGLMQLTPRTWRALRVQYRLGEDPFDVHDNIIAGAAYLSRLYQAYGAPGFLAAYNAGPERWRAFAVAGVPLPAETRRYLAILSPALGLAIIGPVQARAGPAWRSAPLFASAAITGATVARPAGLFVGPPMGR